MQATYEQRRSKEIADRNRIKAARGRGARSASPAVNPGLGSFPPPSNTQPNNSFGAGFGQAGQPQNGANGASYGSSQPSFGGFGQGTPNPQTNGTISFAPSTGFGGFGANQNQQINGDSRATTPSFQFGTNAAGVPPGFTFGALQQPSQSGFNPSTTSTFGQMQNGATPNNPFQNNSFGQNQPSQETPKTTSTLFSGSFGGPQQNGDKPAETPKPLFSGSFFGQQNKEQENGGLFKFSDTSRGIGEKKPAEQGSKNTPSFTGFGQPPSQETPKPANTSFGQAPQENGSKPAETPKPTFNLFGQQAQQDSNKVAEAAKPLFGGIGQHSQSNGVKTPAAEASNAAEQPKSDDWQAFLNKSKSTEPSSRPGSGFNPSTTSVFNAPPSQANGDKPAESVFGQPKKAIFSADLFTKAAAEYKAPEDEAEDTSMASPENTPHKPLFSASAQKPAQTPSLFGQTNRDDAATPKAPAGDLFSRITRPGASDQSQTEMPKASSNVLFDTSRTTRAPTQEETPTEPPKNPFGASTIGNAPASFFNTPAASKPEAPTTAQKAVPTPLFQAPPRAAVQQPTFAAPQQTVAPSAPATRTSMDRTASEHFEQIKELNEGLREHLQTQNTNQDWTSIFEYYMKEVARIQGKQAPQLSKPPAPVQQQPPAPAAVGPSSSIFQAASQPSVPASNIFGGGSQSQQGDSFAAAPSAPSRNSFAPQAPKPAPPSNIFAAASQPSTSSNMFGYHIPKAAPPSNLFGAQTPKPPPASNLFGASVPKPPATEPSRKRPIQHEEDDDDDEDSTPKPADQGAGKRQKPNEAPQYPKLPEYASETAKLFASTLDKPAQPSTSTFTALGGNANQSSAAPPGFKPPTASAPSQNANANMHTRPPSSTGGFKPSLPASDTLASGGFKPTFAPPAGGFLSAFGAAAKKQEEAEKKKRKAEDYDSEDDDEAEWERKYEEEQRQKKAKIEEASKSGGGGGFKFTGGDSANASASVFKLGAAAAPATTAPPMTTFGGFKPTLSTTGTSTAALSPDKDKPSDDAGKSSVSGSLFDRISSKPIDDTPKYSLGDVFGHKPKEPAPPKPLIPFGTPVSRPDLPSSTPSNYAEKQQPAGNNTWTPSTTLKFGANPDGPAKPDEPPIAPPKFQALSGASAPSAGVSSPGLLKPPTTGFTWGKPGGSSDVSRATTPGAGTDAGATSDGEASKAGGDESQAASDQEGEPEEQVEDKTALTKQDKAEWHILFETPKCKAKKLEDKDGKLQYVDKGLGPAWILKNKETGKTRILLKVPPYGKPALNFSLLPGEKLYRHEGMKGKGVMATFIDHMAKDEADRTKLSNWCIMVAEVENAEKIAKILQEEQPK